MEYLVCQNSLNRGNRWLVCKVFGNLVEGDELALQKRGSWASKKKAEAAKKSMDETSS